MKYVLRGGYVRSRSDGDEHFIGGFQLIALYGLQQKDCVVVLANGVDRFPKEWPRLGPQESGEYVAPPLAGT